MSYIVFEICWLPIYSSVKQTYEKLVNSDKSRINTEYGSIIVSFFSKL
jgi:hypothetical protein